MRRPNVAVVRIAEVDRPVGTHLETVVGPEPCGEEISLPAEPSAWMGMRTSSPLPVAPPGPPSVPAKR